MMAAGLALFSGALVQLAARASTTRDSGWINSSAVSYTHLDVYKRQANSWGTLRTLRTLLIGAGQATQ